MASSLHSELEQVKITEEMIKHLDYDSGNSGTVPPINYEKQHQQQTKLSTFFVFGNADVHAAAYHITKSLEDPWNPLRIQSIFVQESCVAKFSDILASQLKPYADKITHDTGFANAWDRISLLVARLNAQTVRDSTSEDRTPIIVYDIPHEHFVGDGITPVVTLHSFRTAKEAIALSKKENAISSASIWTENHAVAYEVVAATPLNEYFINCYDVPWTPIEEFADKQQAFVTVENSYHYETLTMAGKQKQIVFPFGSIFAN